MNILNYYRKLIKKSRSLLSRIDIILLIAVFSVLIIIVFSYTRKTVDEVKRIELVISPQCMDLFGSDIVNMLIREFEEQNPDMQILVTDQDADIVFFDDAEYSIFINESALASLTQYIHTDSQAGQWALPLVSFMDVFLYNIDVLQAANCDRPPKTRAEFLSTARAVAALGSASPYALGLSQADPMSIRRNFYPWFWANGGDVSEIETLPRVFLDTVAFFGQLNNEGLLAPGTFEKNSSIRLWEFARGNIAMMSASVRDIAFLRHNAQGITFGITTAPLMSPGKNRLGLSYIYAGIRSDCTMPDEAWIFLAFIAGKQHILAEAMGAVPGIVSGNDSFPGSFPGGYISQDSFYAKAWDIYEAAEIADYSPTMPNEVEINNIIREKLTEVLTP